MITRLPELKDGIVGMHESIDPVFLDSPQYVSSTLSDASGCKILLKIETTNPIRSFKGRGTSAVVSILQNQKHLVAASAGNFGQGIAYAAKSKGLNATIFVPVGANQLKIQRMRELGADVLIDGEDFDDAKDNAREYAQDSGAHFVEDGKDDAIALGAGSIGMELTRWHEPIDAVIIPVGNGSLINGIGAWFKATSPKTKIIGVCAEGAPAMEKSWRSGEFQTTNSVNSIADGIAIRCPVPEALELMRETVDEMVLVSEESIITAMRKLFYAHGIVGEPAGVAGLAYLLQKPTGLRGKLAATIICGGNLTEEQIRRYLIP